MTNHQRLPVSTTVLRSLTCAAIVLTGVALAACGGSSKDSAAASTKGSNNRAKVAACLKQQGINLPRRPPGGGPPGGGQSSASRAKLQAALRKCGVNFRRGGFSGRPAPRQALVKFAACVRKHGYNLPAPNTSGNGPAFNRRQVNPNDPKFRAAASKCRSLLPQRPAGAPPAGGPEG